MKILSQSLLGKLSSTVSTLRRLWVDTRSRMLFPLVKFATCCYNPPVWVLRKKSKNCGGAVLVDKQISGALTFPAISLASTRKDATYSNALMI